jgi:hypothetical protein
VVRGIDKKANLRGRNSAPTLLVRNSGPATQVRIVDVFLPPLFSPSTEGGLINYASNGRNFNNCSNAISSRGDFGNPATVRKSGTNGRGTSETARMPAPPECQQRQGCQEKYVCQQL